MGLVQSWAKKHQNRYLGPYEMRDLLVSTGTPATGEKVLGPFPNVKAAIEKLKEGSSSLIFSSSKGDNIVAVQSLIGNRVRLQVSESGTYSLGVYTLQGQEVSMVRKRLQSGIRELNLSDVSPGMYIFSVIGNSQTSSCKFLIK